MVSEICTAFVVICVSFYIFTPSLFRFIEKHNPRPFPYADMTQEQAVGYVRGTRAAINGLAVALLSVEYYAPEVRMPIGIMISALVYLAVWKWLPVRSES